VMEQHFAEKNNFHFSKSVILMISMFDKIYGKNPVFKTKLH